MNYEKSEITLDRYGNASYIIVRMDESEEELFALEIERLMIEGFELLGGLVVRPGGLSGADILQPMIWPVIY